MRLFISMCASTTAACSCSANAMPHPSAFLAGTTALQTAEFPQNPTTNQIVLVEAELGLTAVTVTLSGFQSAEVSAIYSTLAQSPLSPAILALRTSIADLERQIAQNNDANGSSGSPPANTAEQQQLIQSLATAKSQLIAIRTQLNASLRQAVQSSSWSTFDRVRAAPAALPAQMRVLEWSADELNALKNALFEERKADGDQTRISAENRQRLSTARTNPAVVEAASRLTLHEAEYGRLLRNQTN